MLAQVTFAQGRLSEAGIGLGTLQVDQYCNLKYPLYFANFITQYLKTVLG
jgi:hypothetical protein